MPEPGKIYVPIDLRTVKKGREPFIFQIDDDEEPPCVKLAIFSGQAHVEIQMGEANLDNLFDAILKNRLELARRLSFQRGSASALRRKK